MTSQATNVRLSSSASSFAGAFSSSQRSLAAGAAPPAGGLLHRSRLQVSTSCAAEQRGRPSYGNGGSSGGASGEDAQSGRCQGAGRSALRCHILVESRLPKQAATLASCSFPAGQEAVGTRVALTAIAAAAAWAAVKGRQGGMAPRHPTVLDRLKQGTHLIAVHAVKPSHQYRNNGTPD